MPTCEHVFGYYFVLLCGKARYMCVTGEMEMNISFEQAFQLFCNQAELGYMVNPEP